MSQSLQPRDRELMDALLRYGILSTRQVKERFFPKTDKSTMLRRLRILEERKLIRRGLELKDGMSTWVIGRLGNPDADRVPQNPYSNRNTIYHEVILSELRMHLEKFGIGHEWTPEWDIKREAIAENWRDMEKRVVVPDGLIIEQVNGRSNAIAIELEITPKSYSRYVTIFGKYIQAVEVKIVWYFVANLNQVNTIESAYNRAYKTWNFYRQGDALDVFVTDFNEFFKRGKEARLMSIAPKRREVLVKHIRFDAWENAHKLEEIPAQGVSTQNELKPTKTNEVKPIESHHNFQNPTEPAGRPFASDPSPSTIVDGQGSEASAGEEVRGDKSCDVTCDLKKCG